jgi:hypothetical protein
VLLAGDALFIAVEAAVVAHRKVVEGRAALEVRYGYTCRLVVGVELARFLAYVLAERDEIPAVIASPDV